MDDRDAVYFACFSVQQSVPETVFLSDIGPDGQLARKRKAHTKSRSGCAGCKARKVKVYIYAWCFRSIWQITNVLKVRRHPTMSKLRQEKSGMCPFSYNLFKIAAPEGAFKQTSPGENRQYHP